MAAAPKIEKAAAERKALRDWSTYSAFKAVDDVCMEAVGAKANEVARRERTEIKTSFMLAGSC